MLRFQSANWRCSTAPSVLKTGLLVDPLIYCYLSSTHPEPRPLTIECIWRLKKLGCLELLNSVTSSCVRSRLTDGTQLIVFHWFTFTHYLPIIPTHLPIHCTVSHVPDNKHRDEHRGQDGGRVNTSQCNVQCRAVKYALNVAKTAWPLCFASSHLFCSYSTSINLLLLLGLQNKNGVKSCLWTSVDIHSFVAFVCPFVNCVISQFNSRRDWSKNAEFLW